jgi:hypothetical protein
MLFCRLLRFGGLRVCTHMSSHASSTFQPRISSHSRTPRNPSDPFAALHTSDSCDAAVLLFRLRGGDSRTYTCDDLTLSDNLPWPCLPHLMRSVEGPADS